MLRRILLLPVVRLLRLRLLLLFGIFGALVPALAFGPRTLVATIPTNDNNNNNIYVFRALAVSTTRLQNAHWEDDHDVGGGDGNGNQDRWQLLMARQQFFSEIRSRLFQSTATAVAAGVITSSIGLGGFRCPAAAADPSIAPCARSTTASNNNNCVSTASVKQVDLFMSPWTWPEGISAEEVLGRLKGVIASDATLTLVDQQQQFGSSSSSSSDKKSSLATTFYSCKVRAVRNFCTDEIEFVINPVDRVVTFRSQQIEGPDSVSDFGANRKRLDEIRKRMGNILTVMGADFASADSGPREGTVGQLKAFWGFQSGGGFESVLLDQDDDD